MKEQLYQLFQGTTGAPTVEDLLLRVGVSVVIGLAIFVSYWISHAGTIYSQKFNINLITLTIQMCIRDRCRDQDSRTFPRETEFYP